MKNGPCPERLVENGTGYELGDRTEWQKGRRVIDVPSHSISPSVGSHIDLNANPYRAECGMPFTDLLNLSIKSTSDNLRGDDSSL